MTMYPIPPIILEILNGWLALLLPWVIWSALRYLIRRRKDFYVFHDFYRYNKMAIAILTLFTGLEIRTVLAWLVRHSNAHGSEHIFSAMLVSAITPLFVVSSAMTVLGAICWARVARDMPLTKPLIWIVMIGSLFASVAIGLYW